MFSRRDFLKTLGKGALCLGGVPWLLHQLGLLEEVEAREIGGKIEVEFYKKLSGKRVQCFVCPRYCVLEDGEICFCLTRQNLRGRLINHAYKEVCKIIPNDPIERLPLHHFYPKTQTLSLATGGCNLRCLYCQNWQLSQRKPVELRNISLTPKQAYQGVKATSVQAIAYTYTEPVAFLEYMKAIARYTKPRGVKQVVATALFINEKPLRDLCQYIDAFAVALKGFNELFYQKVCGEPLQPVLDRILTLKNEGVWLEIVTLLVPTYNTSEKEIQSMCRWIRKYVGRDTPLHFTRFFPRYKLKHLPMTSLQDLERACEIALSEGLRYVYIGNVAPHRYNHTYCPRCQKAVIERLGFKVLSIHLRQNRCKFCGYTIQGVLAK